LGFLCNRYSATWRSGQPDLSNGFKTFDQTIGSRLNFLVEFPEAVFLRVDMESQLGDEEVRWPRLE